MRSLDDRVAVVTGDTYGVGRGIARALHHEGAEVFVTGDPPLMMQLRTAS